MMPDAANINIPKVRTSFVGRAIELDQIMRMLATSHLVTLTGAAGCGKTRLAMRAARKSSQAYPGGVHWIELAHLEDETLIPQTVAKVLHIPEDIELSSLERLLDALYQEQLLLVLDNCEHILGGCAQLVESLLTNTEVSVLATSREPLSLIGERLYPVAPLTLPPKNLSAYDIGELLKSDAIQLFIERARAVLPGFELSQVNAATVVSICRKLNGIPLAIELTCAQVKVLTVEQIASLLDDHFLLLRPATQITYSHHETMRAAIDWGYYLLTEPEKLMLRRLSVFTAGCSLATAETVCAGNGIERAKVLDLISALVDKSFVMAETLQPGAARYFLLETIRQYGQERLKGSKDWLLINDQHLVCFLMLMERNISKLNGSYQELWLNWLEGEYDNICSALKWSLEGGRIETSQLQIHRIEAGLRIAIALYQFWTIRDYVEEGMTWFERLLAASSVGISPLLRANAMAYASFMAGFRGNIAMQIEYGRKAITIAEEAGEESNPALIWALAAQSNGARAEGDYQTEFNLAQRIIRLQRKNDDPFILGIQLSLYSVPAMALGKYDDAREMLEEGLTLLRQIGNPYRIAMALNYLGDLARCEKKYYQAKKTYEESLAILHRINASRDLASVLHNLGHACLHLGERERAEALFNESLASHQEQGNRPGMAECLLGFAALAVESGNPAASVRLLAAAEAIGKRHVTSQWAATRMEFEIYLARARSILSEEDYKTEESLGRVLTLERAIAYAGKAASLARPAGESDKMLSVLTPREREISALIAQALSNGEIAKELVVSKRTVETHISHIRSKLGFKNRSQIVRWATEASLLEAGK